MTLNSHFALNTAFRVKSFSVDALVLKHDCLKIDGDAHILSAASIWYTFWGFWWYKAYAEIRRGLLVRWCQMRVRLSKMRVFYFDRYHIPYDVSHYISKFVRLRAVSRLQHGSCRNSFAITISIHYTLVWSTLATTRQVALHYLPQLIPRPWAWHNGPALIRPQRWRG